jgi:DNA polymerase-3 subunit epsilon
LRLIAQHRPPANRVARNPEKIWWLYFSTEAVPRLVISKVPPSIEQPAVGPFVKKFFAEELRDFINDQFKLRNCLDSLSNRPNHPGCIRGEMNHCAMPCQSKSISEYFSLVETVQKSMLGQSDLLISQARERMFDLSNKERFEEAQRLKLLIEGFSRAVSRINKLRRIASLPEILSTTKTDNGIELHLIRFGRLVAAARTVNESQVAGLKTALSLSAEQVEPRGILPARAIAGYDEAPAAIGEAELLMRLPDIAEYLDFSAELLPFS